jgi:lysophospholipase L1-like esterase
MKKMLPIPLLLTWLLGAGLLNGGCMKSDQATSSTNDSGKTYLALGDSYTIGQSVSPQERFPAQTAALLRQQNINIKVPQYIATTGWTTANLLSAIASQNLQPRYDVVTLLIGVNDQYQGVDTASYRQRFTQSLLKAIELAGLKSHVFVVSIPDYSVTPFVAASDKAKVRQEIDWFNAINLQVSQQMNITYVDIIPSSREGATNAALIAGDGLHPSGLEYKKWAAMLAPLIRQVLQ